MYPNDIEQWFSVSKGVSEVWDIWAEKICLEFSLNKEEEISQIV